MNRPAHGGRITPADRDFARSILIHQDRSVLGFNKPSGLASQSGSGITRSLDGLLGAFARSNGKRPVLVHRLDRGTSGVILAACTRPAAAFLSEAFARRAAVKTYLCLVSGDLPAEDTGIIESWLAKVEEGGRARMIPADAGRRGAQPARTAWRILQRQGSAALMQVTPETGRMHQIRVHLMSLRCPILGDSLYGRGTAGADRVMLHAACLEIPHPDGGILRLEAPLPADFLASAAASGLQPTLK